MILWKNNLSPFIRELSPPSASFMPVLLSPPGVLPSIHVAVYLPTAGRDTEYFEELSNLSQLLSDLQASYPGFPICLRGDMNTNIKNKMRYEAFMKICRDFLLIQINLDHPTYHHFVGNGMSDSQLDMILHQSPIREQSERIICKLVDPMVTSHHDLIFSRLFIPTSCNIQNVCSIEKAPRILNDRAKIIWSEDGINSYQYCVNSNLERLRELWANDGSEASFSILLQATNALLDNCARSTNKSISLAATNDPKSCTKPKSLVKLERMLKTAYSKLQQTSTASLDYNLLRDRHNTLKKQHKNLQRHLKYQEDFKRNKVFNSLNSENASIAYKRLQAIKNPETRKLGYLSLDKDKYSGDDIPDAMYESIKRLKTEPVADNYESCDDYPDFQTEYNHVLDICQSSTQIPFLSPEDAFNLLKSIRKNVNDFFSVTALHYLNAGMPGVIHFQFLMNTVIANVNYAKLPEMNTIYACVLFKGHSKCKEDVRSYRTISTCPLLSKALDIHVRNLSVNDWNNAQADTQYQGEGRSHELACLLLTETINFSIFRSHKPVFALFLDARAAFDRVLPKILIRNMFVAGTNDQRLLYMNHRLSNRRTFCEFQKQMMGPILDVRGLEQGGVSSSDSYKIYNNEQAISSQETNLGVQIFDSCVSCISLADDVVLLSHDLVHLFCLLLLTTIFCSKYDIQLVPEKTKLVAFAKKSDEDLNYAKMVSPISLYGKQIPFSSEAEHLGVLRASSCSNMPALMSRMSAHRKKLFSLLPASLARHHYASPAACLQIERLYALPVLLSGLATIVLTSTELKVVHVYYKNVLRRLMKLPIDVPEEAIYFLAGSLPFTAHLHLRCLALFGMICNLRNNILFNIAEASLLTAAPSHKSWFTMLRNLCIQYGLPHPLKLLQSPMPPVRFKSLCKSKVHDYWHVALSNSCNSKSSLQLLRP